MTKNLQEEKIKLIQWLTTLDNPEVIQRLMELKNSSSGDWWETISESEKESIEKGIKDANEGNLKPHSEAKKIYGKWL